MHKKAQISTEYMFIIGLAMAILIPGSVIFYQYTQTSNEQSIAAQINQIGKTIINNAETIYVVGKNSWTTLQISFPETIVDAYILDSEDELVIEYATQRGVTQAVFFADINITGNYLTSDPDRQDISPNFHSGLAHIKIESRGGYISIGEIIAEK